MQQMDRTADGAMAVNTRRSLWIALVIVGSIGFSFAFACATPFAALAAVDMQRRDLFILVGLAWLANQAIGYGLLGFPQTMDSFAWGAVIGIAAGLAAWAALTVTSRLARWGAISVTGVAFLAAFAAYELALYAASLVLPGGTSAFSLPVVWRIFYVNVIALAGLLVVHRLALGVGLVARSPMPVREPAAA
jgi:hypothetical protein